jgi:TonB family protein
VHWVSAKLRHEREECCDAIAVRHGGDAVAYARALAELEELRGLGASLALAATGGELLARIQRLLGQRPREQRGTALASACAFATLSALVVGLAVPELVPDDVLAEPAPAVERSAPNLQPLPPPIRARAVDEPSSAAPRGGAPSARPIAAPDAALADASAAGEGILADAPTARDATPQAFGVPHGPALEAAPEAGADAGMVSFAAPSYAALESETAQPAAGDGPVVSGGELLVGVAPTYPYGARRRGLTGTVSARISVDASGRTIGAEVVEASMPGAFDRAVLRAVGNWRFAPYLEDGVPVARSFVQHFTFEGSEQGCEPVTGTRFCRQIESRAGKKAEGVRVIRLH